MMLKLGLETVNPYLATANLNLAMLSFYSHGLLLL